MSYFRPSSRQWTVRHLRRPSRHLGLRVSSRRNKEELCRALNRHFNPQNIGTVLSYDASLESIEEYGAIVEIIPTRDRPRRRRRRAVLSPPTESGTALYCDGCTDPLQLTEMPRTHCGHTFNMCIGCISQWVASERTSKRPGDIRCLADECTAALVYEDIEAYVPEDEKQRTLVQFLTEAIGGFSYPTPGCGTQIFADERLSYAQCNACQRRACVECHTEWHTGITCNEYQDQQHKKAAQDDEKSEEFKRAHYQHCPKCQTWIEKIAGCDHMTCGNKACRHEFCYRCGADYRTIRRLDNSHHQQDCTYYVAPGLAREDSVDPEDDDELDTLILADLHPMHDEMFLEPHAL